MKRFLWLMIVFLCLPVAAQRGGGPKPKENLMDNCPFTAPAIGSVPTASGPSNLHFCRDTNDRVWLYQSSTGGWTLVVGKIPQVGTTPTTCNTGEMWQDTSKATAAQFYLCEDGTPVQASGGGGSGGGGNVTQQDANINNNAFARYDTNGNQIQNSQTVEDDSGNVTVAGSLLLTTDLAVAEGGTGASTAAAARTALSAAQSATNADITSLTAAFDTMLRVNQGGTGLSALAQHSAIVGTGTNPAAAEPIQDCPDSGGNHLNYDQSAPVGSRITCGTTGSGGGGTIVFKNDTSSAGTRGTLTIADTTSAVVFADNGGTGEMEMTLATSPATSTTVVGEDRTVTAGAGLGGTDGALSGDLTLTTSSTEADFLADSGTTVLTCGSSNQGKMSVLDSGVLQYCDGATTSAIRRAAWGNTAGAALAGASATSFFTTGSLEEGIGGTGTTDLGSDTYVTFNDGGTALGFDSAFTYVKGTDTLTVGTLVTSDPGDGSRYVELKRNTSGNSPAAPAGEYTRLYAVGSITDPDWAFKGSSGTERTLLSTNATQTVTNKTIAGEDTATTVVTRGVDYNTIQVNRHADECTLLEDGADGEICWEKDANILYVCETSDGVCNTPGEWVSGTGSTECASSSCALNVATTATTAAADDNTTLLATTAHVQTELTDYAADTVTFTNKTYDAEATGNVLTIPYSVYLAAAGCNNTTASSFWDLPTSNAPAVVCATGPSNIQRGALAFDGSTDESAQSHFTLPSGWTGAVDATFFWNSTDIALDVRWAIRVVCAGEGETQDPAFLTESVIADTAQGTTLWINTASVTGITTTDCAAGDLMFVKVFRDAVSDSLNTDANLIGVEMTLRRTL